MYHKGSTHAPPRNIKPYRCTYCTIGVPPGAGFVLEVRGGWGDVACPTCFAASFPAQAAKYLTAEELRIAKLKMAFEQVEEPYQ